MHLRAGQLLLTCLLTLASTQAYAGAWTQAKGDVLWANSLVYYTGNAYFDNVGQRRNQPNYNKYEINSYGEWGLTDSLTIGANLFADYVAQADKNNYSLSNTELFMRGRVYHDDTRVISLQPLIKLPSFAYRGRGPQGGSESWEAELALQYGQSLALLSDRDFVDTTFALRMRSDGLSPQWRSDAKYGVYVTDELLLMGAMYITRSFELDTPQVFREGGDFDYHLTKAEISALHPIHENDYVQFSLFKHLVGSQTGAGQGLSLTYGMRF